MAYTCNCRLCHTLAEKNKEENVYFARLSDVQVACVYYPIEMYALLLK